MRVRPSRLPLAAAATLAALAAGSPAHAQDNRDKVYFSGPNPFLCYVVNEGSEDISFRMSKEGPIQHKPTSQLRSVVYSGMVEDGYYKKGKEEQTRGNYEDAADLFSQLAASGKPGSWEEVYGDLANGDCLELAEKYADAAASFKKIVDEAAFDKDDKTQPRHRLWLDACYREGVALAEAGKSADASLIVDGLVAYAKQPNCPRPSAVDNCIGAIKVAIDAAAGKPDGMSDDMIHVNFRSSEDPDIWFHFNIFRATAYLNLKQPAKALEILSDMSSDDYLVRNPSRQSQVEVLRGSCLFDSDPEGALVALLKIDVMPYGSEDERCEARALAGQLMVGEADRIKDTKDERQADFKKELMRTARLLLGAAAGSTSTSKFKADAKAALDKLPKDEEAATGAADSGAAGDKPLGAAPAPAGNAPRAAVPAGSPAEP
jgi:tetratricopeptide (TPR) repeat protein